MPPLLRRLPILVVLLGLALPAGAGPVEELENAIAAVAERVKPSVVSIVASRAPQSNAQARGSGMLFRADETHYYILTNAHVVTAGPTRHCTIKLLPERETRDGEVVGVDPRTDTAVVRIERRPGDALPLVSLGRADDLRVGSLVLAVGSPFDFEATVTLGMVSSLGRELRAPPGVSLDPRFIETYRGLIQTDASINPGNSGGPLVNLRGEVVGINFAIIAPGLDRGNVGIGFAVPIERSLLVVDDLIERGHAVRGYLGVGIQDVAEAGERLELPLREFRELLGADEGAYVSEVTPNGPAARGGIEPGDLIISINDLPIADVGALQDQISAQRPGEVTRVGLLRAGRALTVEVSVEEMPTGPPLPAPADGPAPAAEEGNPLGLELGEVTPELMADLGLAEGGVLVTGGDPNGPGFRAGLLPTQGTLVIVAGRRVGEERTAFAAPEDLEEFLGQVAVDGGAVQFWVVLRQGDGPPRTLSMLADVPRAPGG